MKLTPKQHRRIPPTAPPTALDAPLMHWMPLNHNTPIFDEVFDLLGDPIQGRSVLGPFHPNRIRSDEQ